MKGAKEILVVDDEIGIRELLSDILFDEGYRVTLAENAAEARAYRNRQTPDLVLLDIWMPGMDGVALLKEWAAEGQLTMPVVMMSGHGTVETAVEATRIGAVDFLEKPVTLRKLLDTVASAIQQGARPLPSQAGQAQAEPQLAAMMELPLREARERFEAMYFLHHLEKEHGNVTLVAQKAGLERTHLYRKIKQLGVTLPKKHEEGE
ncbi:MAG: response regulator [Gallionellaceae bacterium]|jgi:DNA-binding NtrC family response regulator|nr:response regulator [Gallionellaceae bacterium]